VPGPTVVAESPPEDSAMVVKQLSRLLSGPEPCRRAKHRYERAISGISTPLYDRTSSENKIFWN
jgi:hypothetical protein